jgi:signal transduction histidine kinase
MFRQSARFLQHSGNSVTQKESLEMLSGTWLERDGVPIYNQGIITGHLWHYRDVTHTVKAQRELAAISRQREVTLSSISDGVITVDRALRIVFANSVIEQVVQRADLAGSSLHDLEPQLGHQLLSAAMALLKDCLIHKKSVPAAHPQQPQQLKTPSGEIAQFLLGAAPLSETPGRLSGAVLVLRNVTEELQADRMKRDFVSAVSHELRTPLTSIRATIDTLATDVETMHSGQRQEFIQLLGQQSKRLSKIVEDLLDVARIDSGQFHIEPQPTRPSDLAQQALRDVAAEAKKRQTQLQLHAEGPDDAVLLDPHRIVSVLVNLLDNAIKFSPKGGNVSLGLRRDPQQLQLTVTDEGPGIPEEVQRRIFETFYRVPGQTAVKGTGLGLAIVKAIIQLHHGSIQVQSSPQQGSCFIVTLPV